MGASFRRSLRSIVRLALVSSGAGLASACMSTSSPGGGQAAVGAESTDAGPEAGACGRVSPDPVFADEGTFACDDSPASMLAALTPTSAVDYIELREAFSPELWSSGEDAGTGRQVRSLAKHGTACATAPDKDRCAAEVAAVSPEAGWSSGTDGGGLFDPALRTRQVLLYTRGGEVAVLRSRAEAIAFLGSVDNVGEARLIAQANGTPVRCTVETDGPPLPRGGIRRNPDGSFELLVTGNSCGLSLGFRNRFTMTPDGQLTLLAQDRSLSTCAVCGRRPEGLATIENGAALGLGRYFAECAYLEAASVFAFRTLERELREIGAPRALIRRAREARHDEIRHARDTTALARRFGAEVPEATPPPEAQRSLLAIALENAVEGCVRETYGALVASFQAARAAPELRPLLRQIGADEARHAELAHDVDAWLDRRLSTGERSLVARARDEALSTLRHALQAAPARDVVAVAGVPSPAEALLLLDGLAGQILAA